MDHSGVFDGGYGQRHVAYTLFIDGMRLMQGRQQGTGMGTQSDQAMAPELVRATTMIRSAIAERARGCASSKERFLQAVAVLSLIPHERHLPSHTALTLCARTQEVVIAYMLWHTSEGECIRDMARLFGVDEAQFCHAFARSVGVTLETFVGLLRMELSQVAA